MIDGLYVPPKPAIIIPRAAEIVRPGDPKFRVPPFALAGMILNPYSVRNLVLTALTPSAVNTSFTFTGAGSGADGTAAEANLYDNNDATCSADPAGLNSSTHAAYDFGSAKTVRRLRFLSSPGNGFSASITFNIQYSDTNLTTSFSTVTGAVTQLVVPSGVSQLAVADIDDNGSHRYWRIFYASGTTGGNGWTAGLTMSDYE